MAATDTNVVASAPQQGGSVASGFEEVAAEFDRNFLERGEIGAAIAAYWRGEKVVDLWGGRRIPTPAISGVEFGTMGSSLDLGQRSSGHRWP